MNDSLFIWAAEAAAGLVNAFLQLCFLSTLMFVLALAASFALGKKAVALQHALWTLVFLRLVLPPGFTAPMNLRSLAAELIEPAQFSPGLETGPLSSVATVLSTDMLTLAPGWNGNPAFLVVWSGLFLAWLLGCSTLLAARWRRRRVYRRALRRAQGVFVGRLAALCDRWRSAYRIRRRVRLVVGPDALSPFTVGAFRPVVFLPRTMVERRDWVAIETSIAHELAHVARWDSVWLSAQLFVQAVYFFHPIVWLAGTRLQQQRERLCDAMVVSGGDLSARRYAGGLLNVLQLDLQGVEAPNLSAAQRRINVRIQFIVDRQGRRAPRSLLAVLAVAGVAALFLPADGSAGAPALAEPVAAIAQQSASSEISPHFEFGNPLPEGRISWRYGPGHDPFTGKDVFHRGVDVAANTGTPIMAPAAGIVTVATTSFGEIPAAGTVIILDHGSGWETRYFHLGRLEVEVGQRVERGEVVAEVGSTGRSTGPHLHLEVWHGEDHIDPYSVIHSIGR